MLLISTEEVSGYLLVCYNYLNSIHSHYSE